MKTQPCGRNCWGRPQRRSRSGRCLPWPAPCRRPTGRAPGPPMANGMAATAQARMAEFFDEQVYGPPIQPDRNMNNLSALDPAGQDAWPATPRTAEPWPSVRVTSDRCLPTAADLSPPIFRQWWWFLPCCIPDDRRPGAQLSLRGALPGFIPETARTACRLGARRRGKPRRGEITLQVEVRTPRLPCPGLAGHHFRCLLPVPAGCQAGMSCTSCHCRSGRLAHFPSAPSRNKASFPDRGNAGKPLCSLRCAPVHRADHPAPSRCRVSSAGCARCGTWSSPAPSASVQTPAPGRGGNCSLQP